MGTVFEGKTLKVAPKVRLVANCDSRVNAVRAEHAAALRVASPAVAKRLNATPARGERPALGREADILQATGKRSLKGARGKFKALTKEIQANVFITLKDDEDLTRRPRPFEKARVHGFRQRGRSASATIDLDQLSALADDPTVAFVGLGDAIHYPDAPLGDASNRAVNVASEVRAASRRPGSHQVLIGIIDVGGFDFAHEDFVNGGETRFFRIWDQGQDGKHPKGFDFGHEITRQQMNAAIRDAPHVGVGVHDLEPQLQQARHSHATHVASIAAGRKSGVARGFDVAGVLLSMPDSDYDRRLSFYDSTRITAAVDYLIDLVEDENNDYEAVSINISLGTNGHAHDGSAPVCRWIDQSLTKGGRAVCVSAGNSGQQEPQHENDIGFVTGRIHTKGRIDSSGLEHLIHWQVVGNGIEDISENELEIWYPPQDRLAVQLRPPDGDWMDVVEPGEFLENVMRPDGSFVSVYNDLYHEDNGHNTLSIYLSPFLSSVVKGVSAGTWTVRLIGRDIRDGRFDGWIERDDPRRMGRIGERDYWRFPSFFSHGSNADGSQINSLACAHNVIGVANCDTARNIVNVTSSEGPTRDGREKPDICAPGTDILAASGFDGGARYVQKSGTSMASPYVAGVVALMLSHEPKLTAAQITGILRRTSQPLPGASYAWQSDAGFGRVMLDKCIAESTEVQNRRDLQS